jgi:hypothetical protein
MRPNRATPPAPSSLGEKKRIQNATRMIFFFKCIVIELNNTVLSTEQGVVCTAIMYFVRKYLDLFGFFSILILRYVHVKHESALASKI